MPYVPVDPILPSTSINELRNAVARWDYEGGADVTGPQEGYRIDGRSLANALAPDAFEDHAGGGQLDRLVRLLLAASAIRDARRSPGPDVGSRSVS